MAHIRGRQPIGVNQPPSGGSLYPFVNPSPDIKYLLGDFFIAFDDLPDVVKYPLRVKWLYGFGTHAVPPPSGSPAPVHAQDIVVVDANNYVVFDSTQATSFKTDDWDSRLTIVEWESDDAVCRCTFHYEWTVSDITDGQTVTYDNHIVPVNGELQADTWYKLPKRVKSIVVGTQSVSKNKVIFKEGYNIGLNANTALSPLNVTLRAFSRSKRLVPGTRLTNQVVISSAPGLGLGVYAACTDTQPQVKKLNGVTGNSFQNYTFDSEGCLRSQRPVGLLSYSPRTLNYGDFNLNSAQSRAALKLSNDCTCCCACEYFARTYQGLKRQWFLFKDIATAAEKTRDDFQKNINRWNIQKQIREADNIRIRISVDGNCKIRYGIALCNSSKCCLSNIRVYVTWLQYLNGVLQTPTLATYSCPPVLIDGPPSCDNIEKNLPEVLDAHGQILRFNVDYADPQAVITISGKHCLPDCHDANDGSLKTILHVGIAWNAASVDPGSGAACTYPSVTQADFPADVQAVWTAAGVTAEVLYHTQTSSSLTVVDKSNPFCQQCDC